MNRTSYYFIIINLTFSISFPCIVQAAAPDLQTPLRRAYTGERLDQLIDNASSTSRDDDQNNRFLSDSNSNTNSNSRTPQDTCLSLPQRTTLEFELNTRSFRRVPLQEEPGDQEKLRYLIMLAGYNHTFKPDDMRFLQHSLSKAIECDNLEIFRALVPNVFKLTTCLDTDLGQTLPIEELIALHQAQHIANNIPQDVATEIRKHLINLEAIKKAKYEGLYSHIFSSGAFQNMLKRLITYCTEVHTNNNLSRKIDRYTEQMTLKEALTIELNAYVYGFEASLAAIRKSMTNFDNGESFNQQEYEFFEILTAILTTIETLIKWY